MNFSHLQQTYVNNSEENKQLDKMNSFQLQWTPGKLTGNRNHVFLAWFITVQTVY